MNGSAQIKELSRRVDGSVRVSVCFENATEHGNVGNIEFILLGTLYEDMHLEVGRIDAEGLDALEHASKVTAAYASACASLAYTQCSLNSLCRKLMAKGFSREISRDAAELLSSQGFIDEEDIAQRRAEIMLSRLWGRTRILRKLREEGFTDGTLKLVASYLEDTDFAELCKRTIEKRYGGLPTERREREKLYAALSRLGYSQSEIRAAVKIISEDQ